MVCLLTASHPFVWAHRGAFLETPENTEAAFRAPLDVEIETADAGSVYVFFTNDPRHFVGGRGGGPGVPQGGANN